MKIPWPHVLCGNLYLDWRLYARYYCKDGFVESSFLCLLFIFHTSFIKPLVGFLTRLLLKKEEALHIGRGTYCFKKKSSTNTRSVEMVSCGWVEE
jgi:hypothetical protein